MMGLRDFIIKLTGNLKKQVDLATDISEKKSLIESASILLTENELNMVSGGWHENTKGTPDDMNEKLKEFFRNNGIKILGGKSGEDQSSS